MIKSTLLLVLLCSSAFCMQRVQVSCTVGGKPVVTSGVNSTTRVQASYPFCTINVYITGSGGVHAAIYSDNSSTPLSNPFTADSTGHGFFYAANGHVDVQISGGSPSLSAPYTFGDISLFDFSWVLPNPASTGCWMSITPGTITMQPCLPSGPNFSLQYNNSGQLAGSSFLVENVATPTLFVLGTTGNNSLVVTGTTATGRVSVLESLYNAVGAGGSSSGFELSGGSITQSPLSSGLVNGGYVSFAPVLYNPYNSPSTCFDQWGNPVTQPLPLTGLAGFTAHSTIMWVSTSPTMPSSGSCGAPIPVELDYGLNINSYFLARGGLATDQPSFNSIHSLLGGITAISFTAGGLYNTGTVTHCCGTLSSPQYLGGYIQVGHSATPPQAGTIATVDNPLTQFDGINQGTMYWDDTLHCLNVYNGSTWVCSGGGGGGGTPGGPFTSIQFNQSGAFGGDGNLLWSGTVLGVTGAVQATVGFNSSGSATNTIQAPAGGVTAKFLISTDSVFITQQASDPALSGAGQTRIYSNSGLNALKISSNGSAYTPLGAPGGTNTQVQFNNSGAFGGSPNFTWASNQLTITGVVQSSGGFNASVGGTATDIIQAATGGVTAKWLIALDSLFLTEEAAPAVSGAGQGRIYEDSTTHQPMISRNGATYVRIATSSGSITNGHCASFNGTFEVVDAGGPCTTGGGGGTVSAGTANQVAYYTATGTTVGGAGAMSWNNTTQLLQVNALNAGSAGIAVGTGFIQSDKGFLATSGVSTAYNAFSAPTGGHSGLSGTFTNYVQLGNYSGSTAGGPPLTTSDSFHAGAASYSTSSSCLAIFDGASWACLSGGGGSGTPGGPTTAIQFNSGGGVFGGTGNFTWNNALSAVQIIGGTGDSANLGENYVNSLASNVANHTIYALGKSSGFGLLRLSNGSGSGGFDGNGAQIYATASDGQVQATLFTSGASGSATAFHNSNNNFVVNGLGAVSANGVVSSTGSGGGFNVTVNSAFNSIQSVGGVNAGVGGSPGASYYVNSNQVIDSSFRYVGSGGVNTTGPMFTSSNLLVSGSIVSGSSISATSDVSTARHYASNGSTPTGLTAGCVFYTLTGTTSTDARGYVDCTGTTGTISFTFASAYSTPPVCTATSSDPAHPAAVQSITTTQLFLVIPTINNPVAYICMQ